MAFRFIHCADLHLGTPFKGAVSSYAASEEDFAEILTAPEKAFQKIIDCAIAEKADFVLFAGDIMDSANADWRSISVFSRGIEKLKDAGIPSFVIAGNHDAMPNKALEHACRDAILFPSGSISYHTVEGKAVIGGISFSAENAKVNLAKDFKRQNSNLFHIALFHGNIGGQEGYDNYSPAPVSDLVAADMDYWALGHIHEKKFLSEKNPVILYSGSPLSRNVNEISEKGFYLVEADDLKNVKTTFIPCGVIGFFRICVDLTDAETIDEISKRCAAELSAAAAQQKLEKYFIELVLCGKTVLDKELRSQKEDDLRYILNAVLPRSCKLGAITVQTEKYISKEDFCKANIFAGDLHTAFEKELADGCPELQEHIKSLKRVLGNAVDLEDISEDEIISNAEDEIIRLLMEDQK